MKLQLNTLKRRNTDKRLFNFDLTINLPLLVTLAIGFVSLTTAVVKGYYSHESRIARLEVSSAEVERSEVVKKQTVILEQINYLNAKIDDNNKNSSTRLDRIEDKLDRYIEKRK